MDSKPESMPITTVDEAKAYIDAVYVRQWMRTVDGVEIVPELWVFTYDWRWGVVDKIDFEHRMEHIKKYVIDRGHKPTTNDFWFRVKYSNGSQGLYNGERMTTKCPRCHEGYDKCHMNKEN